MHADFSSAAVARKKLNNNDDNDKSMKQKINNNDICSNNDSNNIDYYYNHSHEKIQIKIIIMIMQTIPKQITASLERKSNDISLGLIKFTFDVTREKFV